MDSRSPTASATPALAVPGDAVLAEVADLLLAVADSEILPYFRRLQAGDIQTKSSALDLVTVADVAAEKVLTAELGRRFPDAVLIGEEAVSADPGLLKTLRGARFAITIDPVDGTRNFAAGLGAFAVMVGFMIDGEPVAAIICDPVARDAAMAARGRGAWLRHADGSRQPIRVGPSRPVESMEVCGGWSHLPREARSAFALRLTRFAAMGNYRCAGHETRLVATGQYDATFYNKLTPWDHVPGVILVREAGGHAAHLDGAAYDPNRQTGGILYATDRKAWDAIHQVLTG